MLKQRRVKRNTLRYFKLTKPGSLLLNESDALTNHLPNSPSVVATALLSTVLLIGGCATQGTPTQGGKPGDTTTQAQNSDQKTASIEEESVEKQSDKTDSDKNQAEDESSQSPAASFEAETLFDLIIAEMAGKQNRLDVTLGNYIKQAHKTNDPGITARAARIAKYMNAHQATLDATQLWLKQEPNNTEALQTITIQLIRAGRFEEALVYMDQLLAQDVSANFDFLIHQSRQLTRRRRLNIIESVDKLLVKYPRNAQLWFSKALLEHQNENAKVALSATNTCLELDPQYVSAIIFKAQLLQDSLKIQEALRLLKKAVKKHPQHKRLGIVYARALVESSELDKAQDEFQRLVETFPQDYDLLLSLALISWENKLTDQSKAYLTQLIDHEHRQDEAYTYLAQIAMAENDTEQAIDYYRRVSVGPHFTGAQVQIAQLFAEQNDLNQARTILAAARNQQPQQAVQYYISEAELLADHNAESDAEALYEKALEKFPKNPNILYSRAMFYIQRDNLTAMEADLREILAENPTSALALNALGYTLADKTDRLEEALELIQKAIALEPDDPAILDSLGWVYFRMGQVETALQYLQRAYSRLQDHEIAAHLGEALWVSGNKTEALRIWKTALEAKPDSDKIRKTMSRLNPN
jgi:tetratricopeptide (TPR) repeat protein